MDKKSFLKNLFKSMLVPLIPLLVIGLFSNFIVQHYISKEVDKNSEGLLRRVGEYMDLILYELDELTYNFDTSVDVAIGLKRVLRSETQTYENQTVLKIIQGTLNSKNIKPYIHSFYLYYPNDNGRFISSDVKGISFLTRHADREWYSFYRNNMKNKQIVSTRRDVRRFDFEESPTKILSLFKRFKSSGNTAESGFAVMNLDVKNLESSLRDALTHPQQNIVVLDENGDTLLSSSSTDYNVEEWKSVVDNDAFRFDAKLSEVVFTVLKQRSLTHDWTYLLLTPETQHNAIPRVVTFQIFFLLAVLIAIVILFTVELTRKNHSYFKAQLAKRKYHMQVLELLALQAQLNPHFLFNTLHTINWKVISMTKGPNDASIMIEHLSSILEYSLREPTRTVPLKEDIQNCRSYVEILKMRYENHFNVIWKCDEEMMELRVPKLILQPLIENSVYHGIKEKEGSCAIKIDIRKAKGRLEIRVIDNGNGMTKKKLDSIREMLRGEEYPSSSHMGLIGTNKRLRLHYGKEYSISVRSKSGWGTWIFIRIPLRL